MEPSTQTSSYDDPLVATQAANLTKAIFQHESGTNYDAVGDAGTSHGAGQWQPATWSAQAKDVLGDKDAPMTQANQSVVAQGTIRKLIAQRKNAAQIAAIWNSGSDQNWENKVGTATINGQQIKYNVPQYVKSVTDLYQQYKGQGQPPGTPVAQAAKTGGGGLPAAPTAPTPFLSASDDLSASSPQPQADNLGTDLSKRLQEGTQAASAGVAAATQGDVGGVASGLLQTAGAAAGAVGDVVNRGLELIPGVKGVENLLGQGAGALAQTPAGQTVAKSIQDFSTAHPELAKDIGAGFNIVTAIPILRGLGTVADVAGDAVAQGLKGVAEKSAQEGFTSVVNSAGKTGRAALVRDPDAIKTLIDERAIPDIEDGKYTTKEASAKLDEGISNIEDTELQPALEKGNAATVSTRFPYADILKNAEAEAIESQEAFGPIKNELELVHKKYGDYLTIQQINDAKRVIARKISQAAYGSPDSSAMKVARAVLQKSVEDGAKTLGLQDVSAINQKMVRLIKAQNILKYIDRKPVKTGLVGGILKDVATGGGELAGNATGVPLAGAYIGRETGGLIGKRVSGIRNDILSRTGKDAVRTTAKTAKKKVLQGILTTGAQQSTKNP